MNYAYPGFGKSRSERISSLLDVVGDSHSGARAAGLAGGRNCGGGAAASSSTTPPAAPFLFSVDGSGLLSRRPASSQGRQRDRSCSRPLQASHASAATRTTATFNGSGRDRSRDPAAGRSVLRRTVEEPGSRPHTPSSRRVKDAGTSSPSLAGALPSAAPSLGMRALPYPAPQFKPDAAARPASSGWPSTPVSPRVTTAPAAAKTRFNNYVVGQPAPVAAAAGRAATAHPTSIGRAARHPRPPRVPTAASLSTSPSLTCASSCETSTSSVLHAEKATARGPFREAAATAEGDTTEARHPTKNGRPSAAAGTAAPPPVRPVLRRLPHPSTTAATAVTLGAADGGSDSSANTTTTTTTRSDTSGSSGAMRQASKRPHVPLMQMTRTFALRRPLLVTREASAGTATGGRNSPRTSPSVPPHSPLMTCSLRAADKPAASPAFAPAPPRASNPSRRSRRTSVASGATNSSAALHLHSPSVDEEAAATQFFFCSMPSFSGAQDADNGNDKDVSSADVHRPESAAAAYNAADRPKEAAGASACPQRWQHPGAGKGEAASCAAGRSCSTNSITSFLHSNSATEKQLHQRRPSLRSQHSDADLMRGTTPVAAGVSIVVERLRERGNQYMMREEFAQAIATYSEAIRLAPHYDVLWGNRAAAFLLTFRYLPAVADCLYVLNVKPNSAKAYWRAAKAYAAAYRFLEAKKYYLLAQQASLKDVGLLTSMSFEAMGCSGTDGGCSTSAKMRDDAGDVLDKATRDRRAIAAEEQAVAMVELYWQHVRAEQWSEAVAIIDKILATACYTGPTAVSWQALRLEALLPLQPKTALAEAEALHRSYPDALELYYVLAKAIFFTVHDAANTRRCLELLDEATSRRCAHNTMLNVHVRYAAMQLREGRSSAGGDTSAVQLEAWAKRNQLREDSRVAELRHCIGKFARHRDAGNAAYEKGHWDAAAAAYTQCLQTDRLNHALLAAVYCNRTAVYMQAGRWREALGDADAAIRLSPQLATAYGRRGRIQLYLLSQEYEAQRALLSRHFMTQWSAAVRAELTRYADAAVADLTRAVELSPTAEHKSQLQQALVQRQTVKAALSAQAPRESPGSAAANARASAGVGSSGSFPHQRSYPNSRPASSPASSAYLMVQQHLQLLGLQPAPAAAGGLPDVKVIAKAYRESALRWHPDKWVSSTTQEQEAAEHQFKLISLAYTALRERCSDLARTS